MKHIPHLLRILTISSTSLLVSFLPGVASGQTADPATADLALSTISVSSTSVSTDVGTVDVTVQIRDEQGNSMDTADGDTIEVLGTFDGGATADIEMTYQSAGEYTGTLTNTTVGEVVISATLNGGEITSSNPTVTFTPGVFVASASTIDVSSYEANLDETVEVTVTAFDAWGNRLNPAGLNIVITSTGGTISNITENTTNITADLTNDISGQVTVHATSGQEALSADVLFVGNTSLSLRFRRK